MYSHCIYSRIAVTQKYYNLYFHFMELCPAEQHVGKLVSLNNHTECTHVNVIVPSLTTLMTT
jgi:hypothetical protein